ncbi:MAG: hypothetical protein P4L45_12085 [Ignavibacteriaceae bacterium]|nr:hypothetical protein [Ignavibacteriaceae bacterium]
MNVKNLLINLTIVLVLLSLCNTGYAQGKKYPNLSESQLVFRGDDGKWDADKVHTFSVVEANKDGYKYWAYYGLSYYASDPALRNGGLARSNDLVHWVKYDGNPIVKGDCRWPTVVLSKKVFYMFYAEYDTNNDSRIVMVTSKDGIHFDNKVEVVPMEKGMQNQNPFIYFNKNDKNFYLAYFHGIEKGDDHSKYYESIQFRKSKNIAKLSEATPKTIMSSPHTLAAPSIAYYNNKYYLFAESWGGKNNSMWVTLGFVSDKIDGKYTELSNSPVFADNDACAFQYVLNNQLYVFYSHCLDLAKFNWELRMVKVTK